jgi:hypothetical protein
MSKKNRSNSASASAPAVRKPPLKFLAFLSALFLVAAYYNQWVTMEKLSEAVGTLSRFGTIGDFLGFLRQYGDRIFDGRDAFFFHLLWIIPALVGLMEWRGRALSRTIALLPRTTGAILLYLTLISLVCLRAYFARGADLYNGDAPYFFFLVKLMSQNLGRLILFPFYTFMHGGGAATNQFYGPLLSYAAGAIGLVTGAYPAVKITLFLFHLASVFGTFLFLRLLTGSRRAAFIGALAAILLYYRSHIALFPGRYGEASLWAVYPFLFWFFERLVRKIRLADILLLGVTVAFLIFASIGLSYYFILFFGLYAVIRILTVPGTAGSRLKLLAATVGGGVLGLALASYYLYSFLVESKWNITAEFFSQSKIGGIEKGIFAPTFLWNAYQISLFRLNIPWQTAYFGASLLILALIGTALTIREFRKRYLALVIPALLSLFLLAGYGRIDILLKIPYLHTYTQSRLLNLVAFAVITLSAAGFHLLDRRFAPRGRDLLIPVMALMLLDLFPATFHDTASKRYGDDAIPFFDQLKKESASFGRNLPDFRAEIVGPDRSRAIHENWRPYDSFVPETGIPLVSESGNDYIRLLKSVGWFRARLTGEGPAITERILDRFYYLYNTKYILSTIGLPPEWFQSARRNGQVYFYEMRQRSPAYFTSRLVKSTFSSNEIARYLASDAPDPATGIAAAAWVTSDPDTGEIPSSAPQARVVSHTLKVNRADLVIESAAPVYAVLSYAAYPTLRVLINGKPARLFETVQGTIAIRLEAGLSRVSIRPARSRLASFFFWIPLAMFIAIGVILAVPAMRKTGKVGAA